MTNFEKFKDEICNLIASTHTIAVTNDGKVTSCNLISCTNCKLNSTTKSCDELWKEWLKKEHVERKTFTTEEKRLINVCLNIKFLARDEDGTLYGYTERPLKTTNEWRVIHGWAIKISAISSCKFAAIKWSDKNPVSREEIWLANS